MANSTLNFTAFTTPDQGGTGAVTSPSTTGHGASATQIFPSPTPKSCKWQALGSSLNYFNLVLKLDWAITVSPSPGPNSCLLQIDYTINGGSSWTNILTQGGTGNSSGSITQSLPHVNTNLIEVRDRLAQDSGTGTFSMSISNIRIEADKLEPNLIIMM